MTVIRFRCRLHDIVFPLEVIFFDIGAASGTINEVFCNLWLTLNCFTRNKSKHIDLNVF